MDYRIEKRDAFQVIAKRAYFEGQGESVSPNIHATWAECIKDGTIQTLAGYVNPENIFGGAIVGITFADCNGRGFDYAIGAAYTGGPVAEGLTIEEIPANTWAIFPCTGKMPEAFTELWKKIYTEFFPASKYQPAGGLCVEVYPSADVSRSDFSCEIWISVEEK